MVAAAAIAGEVVDVREMLEECRHERAISREPSAIGHQPCRRPRPAAARPRHRHRPHHAGALPASPCRSRGSSSTCSRTTARPTRRTRSTTRASTARRCSSSTRTSAADRRASTRRRGSLRAGIRAIVGESFSEIFLGNAAMLGMPCFVASHDDVERLQTLIETGAGHGRSSADVATGVVTAGALRDRRGAAAGAARRVPVGPVEPDGDAARSLRRGPRRRSAAAVRQRVLEIRPPS